MHFCLQISIVIPWSVTYHLATEIELYFATASKPTNATKNRKTKFILPCVVRTLIRTQSTVYEMLLAILQLITNSPSRSSSEKKTQKQSEHLYDTSEAAVADATFRPLVSITPNNTDNYSNTDPPYRVTSSSTVYVCAGSGSAIAEKRFSLPLESWLLLEVSGVA